MSTADRLVQLLSKMEQLNASDLFFTEGAAPAVRIHGSVRKVDMPVSDRDALQGFLASVLHPRQLEIFEATGDVDAGFTAADNARFRLSCYRQRGRLAVVARALPSGELSFSDLELPDTVQALADRTRGLVLVTGATGSGKSTTLAAMIHRINTQRQAHIVTIEDPIEFVHSDKRARVSQREVGADTADFHAALRHAVRQSPDVLVIGELRDAETVQVAMSAALTGHLVLASLHTIDASQTLQRILSFFSEDRRVQVAMDMSLSLAGVVSQRLVPRRDGQGRVVAVETLTHTPGAARLIRDRKVEELADLMRSARSPHTVSFNRALLRLYRDGVIDFETGRAYATNPDEFALSAQGMETGVDGYRERSLDALGGLDMKALLELAQENGASDLHLTVGRPPILRIDGRLRPIDVAPLTGGDMRILLFSILTGRQRSSYELERELDFALALDTGRRFRVNAYYQKGHMAAALRAIPDEIPDAEALGLPETLIELGTRPHGLLLVCGPTGSGKSTTLACLVNRINRTRACRIITVEDPIEYTHVGVKATIDQREVAADTRSFAAALKYVLRQDPDVILVGEMRDLETVQAAMTAAETGHLVLATLHSNDAVQTIDRVVDVFPPHQQAQARSQLAAALLGIISQRLLPRATGNGRVPSFEVLVANPAIRNLVRDNKLHQIQSIMEANKKIGMKTMDAALVELYDAGDVSYEDAVRYMRNPKLLRQPGS